MMYNLAKCFFRKTIINITEKGDTPLLDLLIIMLERVGTIIAVAFILTRFRFFKNMVQHDKLDRKQELTAILFFGFFGIVGRILGLHSIRIHCILIVLRRN